MKIKGKVHCFFEQSGTFKNEFIKLGIPARDYDIMNEYAETDNVIDLFSQIEKAFEALTTDNRQTDTIFDSVNSCQDLIIAFFPCIYFCEANQNFFELNANNYKGWNLSKKIKYALDRNEKRNYFYQLLLKFVYVCDVLKIRLIIENPYSSIHYLAKNFPPPTIIDKNRSLRGDFFVKPTQYWFFNCTPTFLESIQPSLNVKTIKKIKDKNKKAGHCDKERSLISPDYARNFICDFILGKEQHILKQLTFNFN